MTEILWFVLMTFQGIGLIVLGNLRPFSEQDERICGAKDDLLTSARHQDGYTRLAGRGSWEGD